MATILKKQKSLYISAIKYFAIAFAVAIIGRLLLPVHVFITIATLIAFPIILGKSANFLVGAIGEYLVTRKLCKLEGEYYIINDINIPGMQIDHTLVCPKGVFTIETKTYIGKVYGNGNAQHWKQYIKGSKYGIKRYSPIKQGRAHSAKLYDLLVEKGLDRRIDTIVVFAGIATVKVHPKPIPVLYRRELYDYISKLPDAMNREEVNKYKDAIMSLL